MRTAVVVLIALMASSSWSGAPGAQELGPRFRVRRWQPVTVPLRHLKLRDGRLFYRGPRLLVNRYPYYLAASAKEKAKGFGYELRYENAPRLLEPLGTPEQASELARLLSGGTVVPDAATYEALRAAALEHKASATGWGVTIKPGRPATYGLSVKPTGDGHEVAMLVFECSGYMALGVVEEHYTIPVEGPVKVQRRIWIAGPPQAWQTAGKVDEEEEARLRAEVRRFRAAMTGVLARHRTLARVKQVCAAGGTFAEVRFDLGEPDAEVGSGLHIYVYRLQDGTAVIFGVSGEDEKPMYVHHVESASGRPGQADVGRLLEKIQ